MESTLLNIHTYDDYRKFLKDRYQELRDRNPKYSHRYLCHKVGFGSTSTLADIFAGRRNLSTTMALKIAHVLQLKKPDEEYFLQFVEFNQAGSLEEKNLHYAKMIALIGVKMDIISPEKFEYFGKWYYTALRELLYFFPCQGDFKALGNKLNPSIPAAQVRKAILLMEKLGIVVKDSQGYYRQSAKILTNNDFSGSLHVDNYQKATMQLAIEALDHHTKDNRDMSTLTATLSLESLEKVKISLKDLRKTVLALAEQDEKVDRVYQLNIQLFPLTRN